MENTKKIMIEIPKSILNLMEEFKIPEDKQGKMFEEYIKHQLGINTNTEYEGFTEWIVLQSGFLIAILEMIFLKNNN